MQYFHIALCVMYHQLVTAACKAESEIEDRPRERAWIRSVKAEGGDKIATLKEQITQLKSGDAEEIGEPHLITLDNWGVEITKLEIQTMERDMVMVEIILKNAIVVR